MCTKNAVIVIAPAGAPKPAIAIYYNISSCEMFHIHMCTKTWRLDTACYIMMTLASNHHFKMFVFTATLRWK